MASHRGRAALRTAAVVLAVATTACACSGLSAPDEGPASGSPAPAAGEDGSGRGELAGLSVTLTATVEEAVSPQAFRLHPGGLLVLSSRGAFQAPVEGTARVLVEDALVQVTGSLRTLDRVAFEEEYGVDYDDEVLASFEGDDVLVAHDLVVAGGAELTLAGVVTTVRGAGTARRDEAVQGETGQGAEEGAVLRLVGVALPVLVPGDVGPEVGAGDVVQVVGEVERSSSADGRLVLSARDVVLAEPAT